MASQSPKKQLKTKLGIQCPLCKEKIYSMHRHDMKWCRCGYCAIDGGDDYTKISHGIYLPSLFNENRLMYDLLSKLVGEIKYVRTNRDKLYNKSSTGTK